MDVIRMRDDQMLGWAGQVLHQAAFSAFTSVQDSNSAESDLHLAVSRPSAT